MITKSNLRAILMGCGSLTVIHSTHAANRYWDGGTANIATDGNGASAGASGDWDTTLLNWDAGASPHVAWNNAANDTAFFAGTVGTVTLKAPVTVGGMNFGTNTYVIAGTAPNNLTLAAGAVITNTLTASNNSITISAPVTVTDTITKAGPGGVLITGDLTIPGTTYSFANTATTAYNNALIFTVRSPLAGAGNSVVVTGSSPVYLTSTTPPTYGGTTTVGAGAALGFDTTSIAGIGGGTGVRSISMGAGSVLMFRGGNLNNTVLGQVIATTNAFTIIANNAGCANPLDLTLFPNASLAAWDQAGTATFSFTGTITPGSNGYRFGSPKVGNNMNLTVANALTGDRAVTVNGGNLRLAAAMNYTGTTTINAGTFTIGSPVAAFPTNGNGQIGGGVYAADILNNGTLAHTSNLDQTLSGVISGTGAVTKTFTTSTGGNAGTWGTNSTLTLSGLNTYAGATNINAGILSVSKLADGGLPSGIGQSTNASTNLLFGNGGTLKYTGAGDSTDRQFRFNGNVATGINATLDASGTGPVNFTSTTGPTHSNANQPRTLTLAGSNNGANTLAAPLANNGTGALGLVKSGVGTWILSGDSSYSGPTAVTGGTLVVTGSPTGSSATTIGAGATLKLDYTINTGKIEDSAVLTLAGGTLELTGGTHPEVVGATTLAAGTFSTVTRSSGTAEIALNTITAEAGSAINFSASNIARTDNTNTNGILGSWATVGASDWATNATNGPDGLITAYTGYTDIAARGPGSSIADGAATNVRILADGTSGNIQLAATTSTINTLLQANASVAATLDTLGKTLRAEAIWIPAGKAALTIGAASTDGVLTPATAGGNLALINDNPAQSLTVNAVIANNGLPSSLSKTGAGTLVLNATNTHSGGTTLAAGTLVLGNSGALGSGALTINGGVLATPGIAVTTNAVNANGDFSIAGTGALTFGEMILGANLTITNLNTTATTTFGNIGGATRTLTLSGDATTVVAGFIDTTTGGLVKNGTGSLTLSQDNTYSGPTTINAGTLRIGNGGSTGSILSTSVINNAALVYNFSDELGPVTASYVISGSGSVTKQGTGTQILTGNSTYTGTTTISAGTLQIGIGGPAGSISGTAGIANNAALVFLRNNALAVGSVISGSGSLTQGGDGTLTLSGINTYTGDTILAAGTVSIGEAAHLGAPAADLIFDGGSLQITGTTLTSISGLGRTVVFGADKNVGLDVNNVANTVTVDQALNQATGGFFKRGAGTAILNKVNTYTGDTTLSAGTLRIESPGSLASGTVYVDAGTFGGNGSVTGDVTVAGAGNLAPGVSAGTLTVGGSLDLSLPAAGTGTLAYELDALASPNDRIAVTGSLLIGTDSLGFGDFAFTNLGGLEVGTYKLITSGGIVGTLDPANLGGSLGAFSGALRITGNDLELVVTPASPFEVWIAGFNVGGLTGLNDDPDSDGMPNFLEFALNSSPADGGSQGKVFARMATVGGTPGVLTLTIAARTGATFAAAGNNQQAVLAGDSLTYLIEASNTLADWGTPVVSEVTGTDATAIQATLTPAAPDAGWSYKTFRTDGDTASDARDFIRAKVTSP
jgi:fibronectin-binding autotransporter adhesin